MSAGGQGFILQHMGGYPMPQWMVLCTHSIIGITNWTDSVGYKRRRAGRGAGGEEVGRRW